MAVEWRISRLEEIATHERSFAMGPFGSDIKAENYRETGVPILRGVNLSDVGGPPFNDSDYVFLSEQKANELNRSSAYPGDLVFVAQGTIGRVGMVPRSARYSKYILSQNLMKVTVNEQVADPLYLYYYFRSSDGQHEILSYANTTGVPCISRPLTSLRSFRVLLPPLPEQRAIASILGSLDDKIELNRRINATLEAIAQALFKSWFVDFDPVRAKMEGRQPFGMDAQTAAFFPDRFEESALGEIPAGWAVTNLDSITEYVIGGDWGNDTPNEGYAEATLCIRGADIPDLQNAGHGKMPTRYLKRASVQKRSLQAGDIVVEVSGGSPTQSTGRAVLVTSDLLDHLDHPLSCSNFCRLVRLSKGISPTYVYYWLRWLYQNDALLQYENGTTGIKNFAFTIFSKQHELLLPPTQLLSHFDTIIGALTKKQQANGIQSRTLTTVRDAILPKLLSGEIRTHQAEALVEADL